MEATTKNSTAAIINLSALSQYFIPLGNFIFPIILWSTNKDKSEFVDRQGKDTINFQLSLFLYSLILVLIVVPVMLVTLFQSTTFTALVNGDDLILDHFNFAEHATALTFGVFALTVFGFMKVAEFFLIIHAAVQNSKGNSYKFPLTIPFIR